MVVGGKICSWPTDYLAKGSASSCLITPNDKLDAHRRLQLIVKPHVYIQTAAARCGRLISLHTSSAKEYPLSLLPHAH